MWSSFIIWISPRSNHRENYDPTIPISPFMEERERERERKKEKMIIIKRNGGINSNSLSYLTRCKIKTKPKVQNKGKPQA